MTDDPYRPTTPTAVLPPDATADVAPPPADAPAQPTDAAPQPADAPAQVPGVPAQFADVIATGDAPNSRLVSLDVPIEIVDAGDGRKAEMIGDIDRLKDLSSQQGDNPYGVRGDCGLVSCRNIFEQFGLQSTEQSVVAYAIAHGLCDMGKPGDPPESLGGSSPLGQARILTDNGVPSHVWGGRSAEDIAGFVQQGRGVLIGVNAGVLWNDPDAVGNGEPNHAITVIGVVRDPSTQTLEGFVVNDSGDGKTKVVSADDMEKCFVQKGGVCVATDNPAPRR